MGKVQEHPIDYVVASSHVVWIMYIYSICGSNHADDRKRKKNQRWAIQREFELVGPTLLKNPLDVGWGLLGSCL